MTAGRLDFEFRFFASGKPMRRPDAEQPMRILVLADLSGTSGGSPLPERKPVLIDVDNAERIFARLAPRLTLTLDLPDDRQEVVEIEFEHIEDFHPDKLFHRLPLFAAMRRQRDELASPATFMQAATAYGLLNPVASQTTQAGAETDAETLGRLLGRSPEPTPAGAPGMVERLLQEVVKPHVVPDIAAVQAQVLAAHDMRLSETMRRILHHPMFQRLEATWRGAWKLATELETGEQLQLGLMDITRTEIDADLRDHAQDLSRSALYRMLCGARHEAPDSAPWSLVVCDASFSMDERDATTLTGLGLIAKQAGTPMLAAAHPSMFGCTTMQAVVGQQPWPEIPAAERTRWQVLRESAFAPWLGLALPRVLQRLPYGARTDPVESFRFEEFDAVPEHEDYLWGNPAYGLAFLAGRAFAEQGWDLVLDMQLDLEDLPSHIRRDAKGETFQQPCAELLMNESIAQKLLELGLMPLMSYRGRNAARLLRWQSIAHPARALAGAWAG